MVLLMQDVESGTRTDKLSTGQKKKKKKKILNAAKST